MNDYNIKKAPVPTPRKEYQKINILTQASACAFNSACSAVNHLLLSKMRLQAS